MKIPKTMKRLCKKCKKHTEQKVSQTKRKTASPLTKGSKVRARKRGSARGTGNMGRYSKPAITSLNVLGQKILKKLI